MTDSLPKPTIVLVHGAFHTPEHFEHLASDFQDAGYDVHVPRLPSVILESDTGDGLAQDTQAIASVLRDLVGQGKDALVHMHSYGGVPGSEAIATVLEEQDLFTGEERKSQGRIRRLIYLASQTISKSQSLASASGEAAAADVPIELLHGGILQHTAPVETFYNTCAPDIAAAAADKMTTMITSPFATDTKYCGWSDYRVPVTYVICTLDHALPVEMQRTLVEDMRARGVDVRTREIESDHSPFLGKREEYFRVLLAEVV